MADILALSTNQNGASFRITSGSFITISLTENPSTGYRWVNASAGELKQLSSNYTPASQLIGSNGVRVFVYQAHSPGCGLIRLNLIAPSGSVSNDFYFNFIIS